MEYNGTFTQELSNKAISDILVPKDFNLLIEDLTIYLMGVEGDFRLNNIMNRIVYALIENTEGILESKGYPLSLSTFSSMIEVFTMDFTYFKNKGHYPKLAGEVLNELNKVKDIFHNHIMDENRVTDKPKPQLAVVSGGLDK